MEAHSRKEFTAIEEKTMNLTGLKVKTDSGLGGVFDCVIVKADRDQCELKVTSGGWTNLKLTVDVKDIQVNLKYVLGRIGGAR